ncbi:hypothetical protein AB1Y20_003753 [Prymnesium parvum]|uniref:EF-hand domain-containing protein n=1 Tax=Prymnesium parvum TaxID=97485 RepID=A0AB34J5T6_PRYPA
MDLEDLSLMLRAFGMIPVPLSNDQVRTVFRQQKIASPQTAQDTLSRKEFPECLLRLAITAALARPDLSGASPQKKLYEFLKELKVGDIIAVRKTFTDSDGIHQLRLAAELRRDPGMRNIQVSVQLANLTASFSPVKQAPAADEPLMMEWTHKFTLQAIGDDTAAVQAVLYANQHKSVPGEEFLTADGSVSPKLRATFDMFDKDGSGGLSTRELGNALHQLGVDSDSQQTIAILQRFDKDGGGVLDVHEFSSLVQEILRFQMRNADSMNSLPLTVSIVQPASKSGGERLELAHCTINLAVEGTLHHHQLRLQNVEGKLLGWAIVSLNTTAALSPFIALRRVFQAADTDGDGKITVRQLLPAFRELGLETTTEAIRAFKRSDVSREDVLDIVEFDSLYREIGAFELIRKHLGIGKGRTDLSLDAPASDGAILLEKRFNLQVQPDSSVTFWVDTHCCLELLEVKNTSARLLMSALDATSHKKVDVGVIFDGGAYFHADEDARIRGGPAWAFSGPYLYEFSAQSLHASSPPRRGSQAQWKIDRPMHLLFRMVSRFEKSEVLNEPGHPLLATRPEPHIALSSAPRVSHNQQTCRHAPSTAALTLNGSVEPVSRSRSPVAGGYVTRFDAPDALALTNPEFTSRLNATSFDTPIYDAGSTPFVRPEAGDGSSALDAYDAFRASRSAERRTVYKHQQFGVGRPHAIPLTTSSPGPTLEMTRLQTTFDALDKECRGTLAFADIQRALRSLGIGVNAQAIQLFAAADSDHDGALRFAEFCDVVRQLHTQGGTARFTRDGPRNDSRVAPVDVAEAIETKAIFDQHDTDHDGFMSTRELRHALRELNIQVNTDQALKIVYDFDRNSDGKLDQNEFRSIVFKLRQLQGITPVAPAASLRAAFGSFDQKGEGSILSSDVRAALERAGLDTTGSVALTIFSRLAEQPLKAVDFSQFQRIAHAVSSQRTERAIPGTTSRIPSAPLFAPVEDISFRNNQTGDKAFYAQPAASDSASRAIQPSATTFNAEARRAARKPTNPIRDPNVGPSDSNPNRLPHNQHG